MPSSFTRQIGNDEFIMCICLIDSILRSLELVISYSPDRSLLVHAYVCVFVRACVCVLTQIINHFNNKNA